MPSTNHGKLWVWCYYSCVYTVYWDNDAANNSELFVKKGDLVGLVETMAADEKPPDGYLRVSH